MERWIKLEQLDEQGIRQAPVTIVNEVEIKASAAEVFAALEDGSLWPKWIPFIRQVDWTTPRPFGVGTCRIVTMIGGSKIDDEFFLWDDNERMAFWVRGMTKFKAFHAFGEIYELTPSPNGTRLRWTVGVKPAGVMKPVFKIFGGATQTTFRQCLNQFRRLVEGSKSR